MPDHIFDNSLYADELRLERTARSEGIGRYRRAVLKATERGDGAAVKSVERLLVHWFQPLRALISAEKKSISEGKPGLNRGVVGPYLLQFNSARMALTTMHTVVDMLLAEPTGIAPIKICLAIARAMNADINYRAMRKNYNAARREHAKAHEGEEVPPRFKDAAWDALTHTDRRRITVQNTNRIAAKFSTDARWPIRDQTKIGACLLDLLCRVATVDDYDQPFVDAFARHKRPHKKHTCWFWRLSDACRAKIEHGHDRREVLAPYFGPMVVPPRLWSDTTAGGYLTLPTRAIKQPAIHSTGAEFNPTLMEALNVVSSTPWRVNRWMLDVVKAVADAGGGLAGVPRLTAIPFPDRPGDFDTNEDARKHWKHHAAFLIRRNCEVQSQAISFFKKMRSAGSVADFERIYFPHQFDFRTRMYSIPILFNHQSDDVCRGMLEFADPVDCTGERGQWWLKVHLANRCGVDKVKFAERIAWADASMDTFAGWVDRPLENTGWMDVDDPFQALASARALLYPEHGAYLPVQIDGSNNALQHYAAMLRDPEAARMVNVLPTEQPEDFYRHVADQVLAIVGADADKGHEIARQLDGWIDRKLVKSTAMTDYYGVTAVGARRQMRDSLKEAGFEEKQIYPASKYLSKATLAATGRACPTVAAALTWLRQCAKLIAKSGQTVEWTTPLGAVVEQQYRRGKTAWVMTPFFNMRVREIDNFTAPVSVVKQVNAFPPNFVHAIDSSHAMSIAIACKDAGIEMAAVHDSLWTHAAKMDRLAEITREQFCAIHEEPQLDRLYEELSHVYPLDFPTPPTLGTLDVTQARHSPYLFA